MSWSVSASVIHPPERTYLFDWLADAHLVPVSGLHDFGPTAIEAAVVFIFVVLRKEAGEAEGRGTVQRRLGDPHLVVEGKLAGHRALAGDRQVVPVLHIVLLRHAD